MNQPRRKSFSDLFRPALQNIIIEILHCKSASIGIIFSLSLVPLVLFGGGVVDYSRATSIAASLQAAVDSAALATAAPTGSGSPAENARAIVFSAFSGHASILNSLDVSFQSTSTEGAHEVVVSASAKIPTQFLQLIGLRSISVFKEATAIHHVQNIEISMVLDISSSMSGARIDSLRQAAKSFVEELLSDEKKKATSISIVPYGGTVRLPSSFHRFVINNSRFKNPNFDYDINVPSRPQDWNGCLEMSATDVRALSLAQKKHGVLPRFTAYQNRNPWCPEAPEASAVFLSNNRDTLLNLLDNFDDQILSDGTGTDIGTSWGVRALDPAWRNELGATGELSVRPDSFGSKTIKVLIVMTDGGITPQLRPASGWREGNSPHIANNAQQLYSRDDAIKNFNLMCEYAKSKEIIVYTISFQVKTDWQRDEMRSCASSLGNFYDVQHLDISEAFSDILKKIAPLRISD